MDDTTIAERPPVPDLQMTRVQEANGVPHNSMHKPCTDIRLEGTTTFREDDAVQAAAALLDALGVALDGEQCQNTPRRMVLALHEMLSAPRFEPTSFDNVDSYDEFVVVRAIPFASLCEHHVLPFIGTATIAYLPATRIVGLSKLARVVQMFSRRLQVQERLTTQIADWLVETLAPHGVGVSLQAEHLCMTLRGVLAAGALTTTTARRGVVAHEQARRREWDDLSASLVPSPRLL